MSKISVEWFEYDWYPLHLVVLNADKLFTANKHSNGFLFSGRENTKRSHDSFRYTFWCFEGDPRIRFAALIAVELLRKIEDVQNIVPDLCEFFQIKLPNHWLAVPCIPMTFEIKNGKEFFLRKTKDEIITEFQHKRKYKRELEKNSKAMGLDLFAFH